MKRNPIKYFSIIAFLCLVITLFSCLSKNKKSKYSVKPNIIYILADDLGYGDLSCYGQSKFNTPNIDKLAQNGVLFTQHYAGSTVCAPSRCSLLTGQHTGHSYIRGNKEFNPEGQEPMAAEVVTVAEVLKESGYVTGAFGKWGLGYPGSEGDPNHQGFDEFFGYNCQRIAHHYYPYHLWHNQKKVVLEKNAGKGRGTYGPEIVHEKALNFIHTNKDKPFFVYYASLIPHAELFAPDKNIEKYRGQFLPEKVYNGTDRGPKFKQGAYGSQPEGHAAFAAMVEILDQQVGEIISTLEEFDLLENTLIIFSSDNGPHLEGGADPDYFNSNGPLKGYKRDLYDGGIRVPMIASWQGVIRPNCKSDHISAFWDFYPTVCDLIGQPVPDNIDGLSFLPELIGAEQQPHDYLYWEFHEKGGRQAVRMDHWKAVKYHMANDFHAPIELYDLNQDIGEDKNVADEYPEIVEKMDEIMKKGRIKSDIFQYPFEKID